MGTESGEDLSTIILRKEWERRLGGGRFLWGIGQSLGKNAELAASKVGTLTAVFSPMPSKPKAIDVTPGDVVLWNAWLDGNGHVRPLPLHTFVTSRATLPSGRRKESHYALVCTSPGELGAGSNLTVFPHGLKNVSTGKGLGASQVTAVVNCDATVNDTQAKSYTVSFVVELEAPYFVRLAHPTVLKSRDIAEVAATSKDGDLEAWAKLVKRLRNQPTIEKKRGLTLDLFNIAASAAGGPLVNSSAVSANFI
jgi:hypothetical protein